MGRALSVLLVLGEATGDESGTALAETSTDGDTSGDEVAVGEGDASPAMSTTHSGGSSDTTTGADDTLGSSDSDAAAGDADSKKPATSAMLVTVAVYAAALRRARARNALLPRTWMP